jgi:dihydroorotate dehydrogenase
MVMEISLNFPKVIERLGLKLSLTSPVFFSEFARPFAYYRANGDAENVHKKALELLVEHVDIVRSVGHLFQYPALKTAFCGKEVMPFGTSAGLDKNADALEPLSYLFGFQEFGTVVMNPREGNKQPRVAADILNRNLYNAQGFPSKGLEHALANVRQYRERGGKGVLLASICGLPPAPDQIDIARDELRSLATAFEPYVDGIVWNPFSPNTAALKSLRTPEEFKRNADIIAKAASTKSRFVKLGPYENCAEEREPWLALARAWIQGGGTGFVAVNTKMVPSDKVPLQNWGYPSAGKSGRALQEHRDRAVCYLRNNFPDATIIATGGIDNGDEAWKAFQLGANVFAGYTPYTFDGFGLQRKIAMGIQEHLEMHGYSKLAGYPSLR